MGRNKEVNACCSKLQGIHAGVLALCSTCSFHKIKKGKVRCGCDNEKGVDLSNLDWLKAFTRTKHSDPIRAIRKLKCVIGIDIHFEHVKGHQDNCSRFEDLPIMAQLNTKCDRRAKQALTRCHNDGEVVSPRTQGEGWQCRVDGVKQTSDPSAVTHKSACSSMMQEKLQKKGVLSSDCFDMVDWDVIGDAQARFPEGFLLWILKHVTSFCGAGEMMKIWEAWDNSQCPDCNMKNEEARHVLACKNINMISEFSMDMEVLEQRVIEKDTCLELMDCASKTLATQDPTTLFEQHVDKMVEAAAAAQDHMG